MPLSAEERARFLALKPECFKSGNRLVFTAPTWTMRESLTFEVFEADLADPSRRELAIRDFANIPTSSVKSFFRNPQLVKDHAVDDEGDPLTVVWDGTAKKFLVNESFRPIPGIIYYLAADLSVSGDRTGIAMVHVDHDGYLTLDFSIQIKADPRVDYRPIEQFFVDLRDTYGFTIGAIGFDQFQSHRTIMELVDRGFDAKVVRYADSLAGCTTISELIHSKRFVYRRIADAAFIAEAMELQEVNGRRVDHLSSGGIMNSKDVWDAVVNATVLTVNDKRNAGIRLSKEEVLLLDVATLEKEAIAVRAQKGKSKWGVVTFVYSRLHLEEDPDLFILCTAIKNVDTEEIAITGISRHRLALGNGAQLLADHVDSMRNKPWKSSLSGWPVELVADDNASAGLLSDQLLDKNSDLMISPVKETMSVEARIETTKELIRRGKVRFPTNFDTDIAMVRLVRLVMTHPYVPDVYDLQALAGAVRNIQDIEFTDLSGASSHDSVKNLMTPTGW